MNAAALRRHCLRLQGAAETFPFGEDVSVFKAPNGKVFAITALGTPLDVSVKCDPDAAASLRDQYDAIVPGTVITSNVPWTAMFRKVA